MTGGMMFKGTPGPWRFTTVDYTFSYDSAGGYKEDGPFDAIWSDGNNKPVCVAQDASSYAASMDFINEEDAKLISAAPELLAALMKFTEDYVEMVNSGDCGFWDPENEAKVKAARAAIAKALGEQK